jgi:NAD(P)-dependent dehydrogenase (short-subunit alcohol dehydrogenase family)
MQIQLDGKIALVTGASSGIGQAIAKALAACGAKVAVNYIGNPATPNETLAAIKNGGGTAHAVQADISDAAQVAAMFAEIDQTLGTLDILVNCAGIDGEHQLSWEADLASWKKVIEINLFGAFHCAQLALQRMTAKKSGVILNITSVHEVIAWTGYSAYTASKAGLSMLTKTLAQEAAPLGVRVLSLAPGAIQTNINRAVWSDAAGMADLLKKIPMARMGQVDEIGRLAAILVSDGASYVTGTTIFADGGMTDYPGFAYGG